MIFGSDSVSSILREDLHGVKVSLAHDYKSGRAEHLCKSWFDLHQTAPWIQPDWEGQIALEIVNHGPLQIELTPLHDRPCQLTFFRLSSSASDSESYGSRKTDV